METQYLVLTHLILILIKSDKNSDVYIAGNLNIHVERIYSGVLMTSLNSAGIHITLLKLPEHYGDTFISCLDSPTNAPKWPGCAYSVPLKVKQRATQDKVIRSKVKQVGIEIDASTRLLFERCLRKACQQLIEKETIINNLDKGCGDGDCGTTLKRLASDILQRLKSLSISHPSSLFSELAQIAEEQMGGTSGALYCLLFTSFATDLASAQEKQGWPLISARGLRNGLCCLIKYGKAKPGDRSMVDVMNAVCEACEKTLNNKTSYICNAVILAAWQACEATKKMAPRVGRASYIKQSQYLQNEDAGAYGVATWITAVAGLVQHV